MSDPVSEKLYERACKRIPGGVNSPVRAFRAVGSHPVFVQSAAGATLTGADGRQYIDYVGSWGPMILGHAHPKVIEAIQAAAARGTSYGAPTEAEIELAEIICEALPSIAMVRLTSTGTEAVMGAIRAARGFTGRDLVVKFEGCYHGGADYLLVKAGSGAATLGEPDSAGVPRAIAQTTITLPFNDEATLRSFFAKRGDEVAAVIVEPIVGNMGCVPPMPQWLPTLREVTAAHKSLLIFDEVMTGFRVAWGGAQTLFGITPDVTCLGKIIGGGLPVGAYGGRREIMELVAPLGPVYQAGTLSGNPLAVAAGLATLRLLRNGNAYQSLEKKSAQLQSAFEDAARQSSVRVCIQRVGSMLTPFFAKGPVQNWTDANNADRNAFAQWHRIMLEQGIYWPPSQFEAGFVSLAHDDATLERTAKASAIAFQPIAAD